MLCTAQQNDVCSLLRPNFAILNWGNHPKETHALSTPTVWLISEKRCEIGCKLLLFTYRKSLLFYRTVKFKRVVLRHCAKVPRPYGAPCPRISVNGMLTSSAAIWYEGFCSWRCSEARRLPYPSNVWCIISWWNVHEKLQCGLLVNGYWRRSSAQLTFETINATSPCSAWSRRSVGARVPSWQKTGLQAEFRYSARLLFFCPKPICWVLVTDTNMATAVLRPSCFVFPFLLVCSIKLQRRTVRIWL